MGKRFALGSNTRRAGYLHYRCKPCDRAFRQPVPDILVDPINHFCSCGKPYLITHRVLDTTLTIVPNAPPEEGTYGKPKVRVGRLKSSLTSADYSRIGALSWSTRQKSNKEPDP